MRIGIDARELAGQPTGVGRYLGGLLNEWASEESARRHEFVLYSPESIALSLDSRRFPTRIVPGKGGVFWEQVALPRMAAKDHLDVFFAPAYTAPLLQRVPLVVAIHDLSFAAHPEWFSTREGIRRRWFSRHAARRARAVITISEFSKRELSDRFGVDASQIHVVPPGINRPAAPAVSARPNVLYVGSIFNRRHVPDLVRAFAAVARRHADASLDIVGDNRSYPRQDVAGAIAAEQLDGRARWRQYVADEELARLYGAARAFAFLSEYEGLGMTPLEALAAGVPPLLADTPVARESCGDAALYVKADDVVAAASSLESLLFDDGVRRSILNAAPAVLAKYTWPRAARDTLRVLELAVDHHR
jgi:glycosyltransferase involved in cell wall biosynthesis